MPDRKNAPPRYTAPGQDVAVVRALVDLARDYIHQCQVCKSRSMASARKKIGKSFSEFLAYVIGVRVKCNRYALATAVFRARELEPDVFVAHITHMATQIGRKRWF